jgi:hypothetical protein
MEKQIINLDWEKACQDFLANRCFLADLYEAAINAGLDWDNCLPVIRQKVASEE